MGANGSDGPEDHIVFQVWDVCNLLHAEDDIDYTAIPYYSPYENVTWQDNPARPQTDTAYVESLLPAQATRQITVRTLTVNDVFLDTTTNRFEFKGNPISISVNDGGGISLDRSPLMQTGQALTIGTATGSGIISRFGGDQFPSTTFSVAPGASQQLIYSGNLGNGWPDSTRLNFKAPDNAADIQGTLDIRRSHVILPTTGTSVSGGTEVLVHNGGQLLLSGSGETTLDTGKIRVDGGSLQAAPGGNTIDTDYLLLNNAQVSLGDNAQINVNFLTLVTGNNTVTVGNNPGFFAQMAAGDLVVRGDLLLKGFASVVSTGVSLESPGLLRITESATLDISPGPLQSEWLSGSADIGPGATLNIQPGANLASQVPIQSNGRLIVAGTFQPEGIISGNGYIRVQPGGKLGPLGADVGNTLTVTPDIFMDDHSTFEVVINPTAGDAQKLIANSVFGLGPHVGTLLKLSIFNDAILAHGTKFVLVDYPDGNNIQGHFSRQDGSLLYEGDLITVGLNTYRLSYADPAAGGSAITLTVQPHSAFDSATFRVGKAYSDQNTTPVNVTLACTDLPDQSDTISPGNPATFILDGFVSGTVSCEITESGVPNGYTPSYLTNDGTTSATSCVFNPVETNHNYACSITNTLQTYPVSVVVTGLLGTGFAEDSVKLQNNATDTITEAYDGTYSFPTELQSGAAYDVTVSSQPATQTCTVSNGTGTVQDAPVTGPTVNCVDNPTYPVSASITGLLGTGDAIDSVKLQNNGTDTITEAYDGTYSFPTELQSGAAYDVTVSSQPATQTCTVSNGTGTVGDAPVTGPAVNCVDNPINPVYVPVPVLDRNGLALLILLLLGMGIIGVRRTA